MDRKCLSLIPLPPFILTFLLIDNWIRFNDPSASSHRWLHSQSMIPTSTAGPIHTVEAFAGGVLVRPGGMTCGYVDAWAKIAAGPWL
jgi:hypothetical protein